MPQSERLLNWAIEAEDTATALANSGDMVLVGRFLSDRDYFLSEAAALEAKGE